MSHHVVEARSLCYDYPDGTPALRHVSFRITHGQAVAFIGPNGAGKSTLLLHLCGCLWASRGEARVGDVPVCRQTPPHIRRTVGLVFQDPDDQLFMPTVADDLAFGPLNLGLRSFEHTRLVATHDLDLALDVCSRVILLDRGAVAADGPAMEVLNDAALLQRHGLEKPLRLQACPRCSGPARGT